MEDKFIYEGTRIKNCIYRENRNYIRSNKDPIEEEYYCKFYPYELKKRRQSLEVKLIIGVENSNKSPFYIEIHIRSSFLIYDIRYMQNIEEMLKKEAFEDLIWSYLASLVLKLTYWSNKYQPYFLSDFKLDQLKDFK